MKRKLSLYFIIIAFVSGCSQDAELRKSVFIPDRDYPELPAYSEWGYNTFGAYYDRDAFINSNKVPVKVVVTDSTTSFLFSGQKENRSNSTGSYYEYYSYVEMSVNFRFRDLFHEDYTDLASLNGKSFDLKSDECEVIVTIDGAEYDVDILRGELEFKKAQNLLVDTEKIEVILSGHFDLQTIIDDEPIALSDGRFDVGVGKSNFFRY